MILVYLNVPAGAAEGNMNRLLWIVDNWISKSAEHASYENWKMIDGNLFRGSSGIIKDGEIQETERISIEKRGQDIFYIADVKHNPEPVEFKMTLLIDSEVVFENPAHDFPQKITYRNEEGSLHAFIEGPGKNGGWEKIDFYMTKQR